jgi:DNA transposition AAA+ family ATPase
MALANETKKHLSQMGIPAEIDMIKRTRSFMLRAGMTTEDMAEAIDYSRPSLGLFLNGIYDAHHPNEANSLKIRAALKEYMDLHDVEAEFLLRGTHYDTADYLAVRRSAMNALRRGTAYLLDGAPGTQKTWTLRQIEHEVNSREGARAVYAYARIGHTPQSFLTEVCINAGISQRGTVDQLIRKLRFFLGKGRTLLMVDEAQHLGMPGLEVLRQLLDLPPYFGVILAGSHDLSQRLSHWQMEQWRSRLRKVHYLNGLVPCITHSFG